jgi:F-type H+-transporting ATPase subunit gamma
MATLKDTKRRILSVKSTQKITRAMKLVSSAKFTRANNDVLGARPYGRSLDEIVERLANDQILSSPLVEKRQEKKILVVAVATDRGLCGGLNTNLVKAGSRFLASKTKEGILFDLALWGRKTEPLAVLAKDRVQFRSEKILEKPSYQFALEQAKNLRNFFLEGVYDGIYFLYSEFKNALTQAPVVEQFLPISIERGPVRQETRFLFEPNKETILDSLFFKQMASKIHRILLEGAACEHAARMTAMDNATNNADDVIRRLTLEYNRARQAAITKELIEITSGAEAL